MKPTYLESIYFNSSLVFEGLVPNLQAAYPSVLLTHVQCFAWKGVSVNKTLSILGWLALPPVVYNSSWGNAINNEIFFQPRKPLHKEEEKENSFVNWITIKPE